MDSSWFSNERPDRSVETGTQQLAATSSVENHAARGANLLRFDAAWDMTSDNAFADPPNSRRTAVLGAVSLLVASAWAKAGAQSAAARPERRWYEAAARMQRLAESWGDQSYGAVLVFDGAIIGEGPSRVVRNNDASAHAEREAIRDASRKLGRPRFPGAVLYSTSRPCSLCEAAAAEAGVSRMYFGESLADGGAPGQGAR